MAEFTPRTDLSDLTIESLVLPEENIPDPFDLAATLSSEQIQDEISRLTEQEKRLMTFTGDKDRAELQRTRHLKEAYINASRIAAEKGLE